MNPSIEDIVNAIEEANAEKVFVLPNNKNIVMAAEQAQDVCEQQVVVIPTKTVPQGLSALLAFNPTLDVEKNKRAMNEAAKHVKSGQITYAVRDTTIDDLTIKKDDFMGILDGDIVSTSNDLLTAAKELIDRLLDDDTEIFMMIKGKDASDEQVDELAGYVEDHYPDVEVEIHDGKQPVYHFLFSAE